MALSLLQQRVVQKATEQLKIQGRIEKPNLRYLYPDPIIEKQGLDFCVEDLVALTIQRPTLKTI